MGTQRQQMESTEIDPEMYLSLASRRWAAKKGIAPGDWI